MHRLGDTCARAYYSTPYMGTGGRWNGANSPIDPWQHGNEGGAERGDWKEIRQLDPRVGPLHREIACPGGTQGGPNCLTHAPPRCFPTPNRSRMGGGDAWRAELSFGLPSRALRIPRTTAVDRRSDSIHSGGPTRSSADFSVPRRCFGAERVFP